MQAASSNANQSLAILGIRGIPAAHGGFETFAEQLALYLRDNGWSITVYCQEEGRGESYESDWSGIRRIHIPVSGDGAFSTISFDWKSVRHAARSGTPVLTLGYNTAIFSLFYHLHAVPNVINMDGIEWRRDKWGPLAKSWLYLNERAGAWLGDQLVADHPEIKRHLEGICSAEKIRMIPYGSPTVSVDDVDSSELEAFGLTPNSYALLIARPEPENSILPIVRAFSARPRGQRLVVLGNYLDDNPYHRQVKAAASDEVLFVGAIYQAERVNALRVHASVYVHGHTVGGTNPSLIEALGAGSPVLAHDNRFNRWVAGEEQAYFADEVQCGQRFDELLGNDALLKRMSEASRRRHEKEFTWPQVLSAYESLLLSVSRTHS